MKLDRNFFIAFAFSVIVFVPVAGMFVAAICLAQVALHSLEKSSIEHQIEMKKLEKQLKEG